MIIKKQTNKQKQKISTIQKERNLQICGIRALGTWHAKKWGKPRGSNSPNVMLRPGFEVRLNWWDVHVSVVTPVPSLSTKRVTSFCSLLPFAVVTHILG